MWQNSFLNKGQRTARTLRMLVLVAVLLLTTALGIMHQLMKEKAPVSTDALCPFGGIESAYTLIADGVTIQRVAVSSFILLAAVLLIALIYRRAFCGFICPLGALQELITVFGRKIFKGKLTVPGNIDRPGRYLKYIVLVVVVIFSAITGELVMRPYDPWIAYHHLFGSDLFEEFLAGFIILMVIIAAALFIDRPFCKYLCPMGAFLGLLNRVGLLDIKRSESACVHCRACNNACPVGIDVAGMEMVRSPECINCNECINVCPKEALSVSCVRGHNVSPSRLWGLMVGLFAAVVLITTATGEFVWINKTLEVQVQEAGEFDAQLIKGRMTLKEVSDASGVPSQTLIDRFKVTHEDFELPIKDIGAKYGFETEDVRLFLEDFLKKN